MNETITPHSDYSSAIYSPKQIACGALLGSPLAGAWLMRSNLVAWNETRRAKKALFFGVIATLAVVALSLVLPSWFPNSALPAAYTFAIYSIAQQTQGARFETHRGANGLAGSNWRVVGVGLVCLALVLAFVVSLALSLPNDWIPE